MKKVEILQALNETGIEFNPVIFDTEGKILLPQWQKEHFEPEIYQLAKEAGHSLLFTQPHYSDHQPIELVQARIKSSIARQYSKSNTSEDVQSRLNKEFEELETV